MSYDKEHDIDSDYETALADGQVHILTPEEIKHRLETWPALLQNLKKAQWLLGVMVQEGYLNADYSIKEGIEAAIPKAEAVE